MNPQAILNMLMAQNPNFRNNPMINNAMNLYNSGNITDLKSMAENLAQQKGVNLDDLRKQIGL